MVLNLLWANWRYEIWMYTDDNYGTEIELIVWCN